MRCWRCGRLCSAEDVAQAVAEAGRPPVGWVPIAVLLGAGAIGAWWLPDLRALDWQPGRAVSEPWRAWTAAFVHYSGQHLAANLAGLVLTAALGVAARVPRRCVAAWVLAWPLTQLGLLLQPQLLHYGGLSGVLHAGVAVAAVHLLASGERRHLAIGAALVAGLVLKVVTETPWAAPLHQVRGWNIAIAPMAHATGAAAGLACAAAAELLARIPSSRNLSHG